jgi:hypothetical protein
LGEVRLWKIVTLTVPHLRTRSRIQRRDARAWEVLTNRKRRVV